MSCMSCDCAAADAFESADQPRQEITITLPDGAQRKGTSWETTPLDIAKAISQGLADKVVIAKVGQYYPISSGSCWRSMLLLLRSGMCAVAYLVLCLVSLACCSRGIRCLRHTQGVLVKLSCISGTCREYTPLSTIASHPRKCRGVQ